VHVGAVHRADRRPGHHPRPARGRRPREGDHQPGVVGQLPVPEDDPAAPAAHARRRPGHLGGVHPPGRRQRAPATGHRGADGVPEPTAHPGQRGSAPARGVGHEEGQRTHQVRCGRAHEDGALAGALPRQPQLAVGQVAQPAVHQLGRPPAGARGEVGALQQHDRQPAGGRLEGHAGAGHPAPDDHHVDLGSGDGVEVRGPPGRGESGGSGAGHRQTVAVPEQPELTIQGWGPAAGPRDATGPRGADGGGSDTVRPAASPDLAAVLPRAARRHLSRELGWRPRHTPPVPVADIRLAPSRLAEECRARLVGLLGEEHVRTDREARLRHAGGKSYLDLLRRRAGDASEAPDAVVRPGSTEETAALLALCGELGVVAVPFGGGTSVVGGLSGVDADDRPSISVDLGRLASVHALDVASSLVTVGPGMRGPALEEHLGRHGLTLGHLPQSWEFATMGGYAATRSAGQASTGVGRFDDLVAGLTLATPSGVLALGSPPASAAGPDLLGLALGSEGALGVITELTLRVRPQPQEQQYEGWSFRSWNAGLAGLQRLARHDLLPDVVRLSDPDETRANLLNASNTGASLLRGSLRLRRRARGCLLVVGWEGLPATVRARRRAAASVLRGAGAVRLGRRVGEAWRRHRFAAPYTRDSLLDAGLLVETLETAATWTALPTVYDAVRGALREALGRRGKEPLVMSHVSHGYATGASLYVTVLADRDDDLPIQQWLTAKRAATDALLAAGGTLTHHHAVGADHRPWLEREIGPLGVDVLRAVKQRLDPRGVCNPGVLLPE